MNKILAILGAGDLGLQIAHFAISDGHFSKVVFFDDFITSSFISDFSILGNSNDIEINFKKNNFDQMVIGIGYNHLEIRDRFYEKFKKIIPFATIIHSSSWIDPTAEIGDGCVIYPKCCIDQKVKVEPNSLINLSCTIAHDTIIGKGSFLSPAVAIAGFCKIGRFNFLGINATFIDNISTCDHVTIGGGAVVVRNILQSGIYIQNPVKKIK